MNDTQLLNEAQCAIPCFHWSYVTTEQFGTVAVTDHGAFNGFVLMTETDFWLDKKGGKLSSSGEPVLSGRQREILVQAIDLANQSRLHSVELVLRELFR